MTAEMSSINGKRYGAPRETKPRRGAFRRERIGAMLLSFLSRFAAFLVFLLLIGPLLIMIGSSFSPADYVEFPPSGFSLKWYDAIVTDPSWLGAFKVTAAVTGTAVPLSLLIGVPAAYVLGSSRFRGQEALSNLFLSPLMLPEVMTGTALLYYLASLGLSSSLTTLVIGHMVVILPYIVRLVLVSVQGLDRNIEQAASILGASPARIFLTITLPLLRPGLLAATIFAVVLSIGELGLSIFLAGPATSTVPILIYS